MRLAYSRPAAVALVAGSVLLAAVPGISFAATAISAATLASSQSCEPLQLAAPSSSPSVTPTPTATPSSASPSASASATSTVQDGLCVAVTAAQASSERGKRATWTVSAWAVGTTMSAVTVKLTVTPANAGTPEFSFGCGKADGTASCDLGTVNPQSARRQFRAQVTVPVTASDVTSVSLKVTGTAAHLPTPAEAAVPIVITTPPIAPTTPPPPTTPTTQPLPSTQPPPATSTAPATPLPPTTPTASDTQPAPSTQPPPSTPTTPSTGPPPPQQAPPPPQQAPPPPQQAPQPPQQAPQPPTTFTWPLPVGSLPSIPPAEGIPPAGPAPVQTQSGNAAGLFPTLSPSPTPRSGGAAGARQVANTSALPAGASVVGAQLAGLAALALAIVFAVTRVSVRRPARRAAPGNGAEGRPEAEGNRDEPGA